ncbi:MAG: hypothetical protein HQK51_06350 [Oligoflexia bacterium]|nr:hypothetical protein [Oligoflexia bacterium]
MIKIRNQSRPLSQMLLLASIPLSTTILLLFILLQLQMPVFANSSNESDTSLAPTSFSSIDKDIGYSSVPTKLTLTNKRETKNVAIKALTFISKGSSFLINYFAPELRYSNHGVAFTEMSFRNSPLKNICQGNCFFEGIEVDAGLFMPFRYLASNPYYKKGPYGDQRPYLLIDTFRVGVSLGANGILLQSLLNFPAPPFVSVSMGGKFYMVYEFTRVRPLDNAKDFLKNPQELFTLPLISLQHIREDFLDNMKTGEWLITSSYIGVHGGVSSSWPANAGIIPSIELRLDGTLTKISRLTMLKDSEENMLVSFGKIDRARIRAALRANILVSFPILTLQGNWSKFHDRSFIFDLSKENEKELLLHNFFSTGPQNIPQKLMFQERLMCLKKVSFAFDFFDFFHYHASARRSSVDFEDFNNDFSGKEMSFSKDVSESKSRGLFNNSKKELTFKTSVNNKGDIFAKMHLHLYNYKIQQLQTLTNSKDHILPYIPSNFNQEDYQKFISTNEELSSTDYNYNTYSNTDSNSNHNKKNDSLNLSVQTIFSAQALAKFFSHSKEEICLAYAKIHQIPPKRCSSPIHYGIPLLSFLTDFKQAKSRYEQIIQLYQNETELTLKHKRMIYRMLKEITDIFGRYSNNHYSIEIVKEFISPEDMYQNLTVQKNSTQSTYQVTEGTFVPESRHLADNPEDVMEMFFDKLHRSVSFTFYGNDPIETSY